ncbi:unnamed protein product [Caenorhabditis sp. 36 PRJEB53466]|nr:unnamed protein product [Caenorhabditis sp. 36 PRJEB53466]
MYYPPEKDVFFPAYPHHQDQDPFGFYGYPGTEQYSFENHQFEGTVGPMRGGAYDVAQRERIHSHSTAPYSVPHTDYAYQNKPNTPNQDEDSPFDLKSLCHQVKSTMLFDRVTQKRLGRQLLGMGQGTVSEMLKNRKTWQELTRKGREAYKTMREWVNASQEDRRRMLERVGPEPEPKPRGEKKKQARTVFTDEQKTVLKEAFQRFQKPSAEQVSRLAEQLGLEEAVVYLHFQNARRLAVAHSYWRN